MIQRHLANNQHDVLSIHLVHQLATDHKNKPDINTKLLKEQLHTTYNCHRLHKSTPFQPNINIKPKHTLRGKTSSTYKYLEYT